MKKQLKQLLSLVLTVAMLLSSMAMTLTSLADADEAYEATLLDIKEIVLDAEMHKDANNEYPPYTVGDVTAETINGIVTESATFSSLVEYAKPWTGEISPDSLNLNSGKYRFYFDGEIETMDDTNGIMFHVTTTSVAEIDLTLGFSNRHPIKNRPFYLLAVGSDTWEAKTVKATGWRNYGALTLPAGFSGWVRIPATTMGTAAASTVSFTGTIDYIAVGPHNLGGKYGTVTIGSFMSVKDIATDRTNVSLGGSSFSLLEEYKHYLGHMVAGDASSIGAVTVAETENETVFDNGKTYTISAAEETTAAGLKFNSSADAAAVLPKDGSLIFYAGARQASGNKLSVLANGTKLTAGSTVYLKDIGEVYWKSATVDADGYVALAAFFDGYVMAPTAAWGFTRDTKLDNVSFVLDSVTVSDDRVRIGSLVTADAVDATIVHVRLDGAEELVHLFEPLLEVRHHKTHMIVGDFSAVGAVTVTQTDNETLLANGNTYAISAAAATTAAGAKLNAAADSAAVLTKEGSVIFYAGARLKADNKLSVSANGTKLTAGATVYLVDIGDTLWQPAIVDADGNIALNAKFEGYVMVPAAAWGFTQNTKLNSVSFVLDSVAVSDDIVRIGSVMTSNLSNPAVMYVRVDGEKLPTLLYKDVYYHADMLETDTPVTFPADNSYINVSDKNTGDDIVPGLDVGYDYEMSIGSADVGEYQAPHVAPPSATPDEIDPNAYYNATIDPLGNLGKGVFSTVEKMDAATAFVPNISANWAKWSWTPENLTAQNDAAKGTQKQSAFALSNTVTFGEDQALMFYVKMPAAAPATEVAYRFKLGSTDKLSFKPGATVYMMSASGNTWGAQTVSDPQLSSLSNTLSITYPAGFEGWVRIPFESTTATAAGTLNVIRQYHVTLDSSFATDGFCAGAVCAVNDGDYNKISIDGGTTVVDMGSDKSTEYYNATVDALGTLKASTHATVEKMTDKTALTPSVPSNWAKWSWTPEKVTAHNNGTATQKQNAFALSNSVPFKAGQALMFYVKLPTAAPETKIGYRFDLGSGNKYFKTDGTVYLLSATGNAWVSQTVGESMGASNTYTITYPAGFEGWVRIPFESIDNTADGTLKTIRQYHVTLDNSFAQDGFCVGAVCAVDNGDKDYGYLTTDGGNTFTKMGDFKEKEEENESNYTVNVEIVNGEKVMTTDALSEDMYVTFPLKNAVTMSTEEALLFYVRQTGRLNSVIRVDLGSDVQFAAEAEYKLCPNTTGEWTSAEVNSNGCIELAAGFEGWIRIPFSVLADAKGNALTQAAAINQIRVLAYQLGGAYGTVRIGSFMLTDYGTEDLSTLRVGVAKEQNLVLLRGYAGSTPVVQAVNEPVNVTATRIPRAALSEGYIYELSAETQKMLDADMGFEMLFFNAVGELKDNRGVLAYVKIPESKGNALAFGGDHAVMPGKEWFALAKGADSTWQKKTANDKGGMELPAGFEGYVRVPVTSMKTAVSTAATFLFAFEYVGGDYGSPLFGSLAFIDNADCDFTTYYSEALTYSESLHLVDTLEGYVLTGTVQTDSDTDNKLSVTMLDGNPLTPGVNGGFAFEVAAKGEAYVLEDGANAPRAKFVLDDLSKKAMTGSESLMFYVKTETANDLWVQVQAGNSATMKLGNVYYTMAKDDAYWTTGVADRNGHIVFEEGFEGWVRIPYTQLNSSKVLSGFVSAINFAFRYVGGDYGKPQIGTILFADNNASVGKLQLYGSSDKIELYGSNQKPAVSRDDVACWESVTIPYMGFDNGDSYPLTNTITATDEVESSATLTNTIIDGLTPFAASGLKFSSDKAVTFSSSDTPRFIAKMGISTEDGVGLVIYVKMPKLAEAEVVEPEEEDQYADGSAEPAEVTNDLWVQFNTIQGRTLSLRHVAMVKTLEKGTTVWNNVFVDNRRIKLSNGFEGYVYLPFEALTTSNSSATGTHFSMEKDNMITALNIGFGEYGADLGDAVMGGLFVAKNDALSHNGAYVDGSTQCVDVFTGETVDANAIKESSYDAPQVGESYLEVPEATDPENYVFIEDKSISTVTAAWMPVPNATRYRVDVYRSFALTTSFNAGMGYEHMYSLWVTDPTAVCEGLIMNNFYLVQVFAFNGDTGIEILPATSAVPEGEIIGGMWADDEDDYEYPWLTDEEPEEGGDTPVVEDQPTIDNVPEEEEEIIITETVLRKKKPKKGIDAWVWAVVIGGGAAVAAGAVVLIILLARRKKKKGTPAVPEQNAEGGEQ